mmetsp:Transcript_11678/g.27762  ORF Transcript_11678/g.27762 Transcript_11678/m.27762 type:complete len:95 (-) Transcript_11678:406-690(-)
MDRAHRGRCRDASERIDDLRGSDIARNTIGIDDDDDVVFGRIDADGLDRGAAVVDLEAALSPFGVVVVVGAVCVGSKGCSSLNNVTFESSITPY